MISVVKNISGSLENRGGTCASTWIRGCPSMDGSGFGLGARSQRYAMIVEDGTVTALEVEDGPGLSVSSAENILSKL